MSFLAYDLTFLSVFIVLVVTFIYLKKKNLKREGILLLYKTKWGIDLIHRTGSKYKRTIRVLSYISVFIGYLLAIGAVYLVGRIVWLYVFQPAFVRAVGIPPITPLFPYIDKLAPSLHLPPFYFTYWVIIIAVIAIFHEFAHGIFAARNKVKIKSTGFGFFPFFLPIFLAAFVELDEKRMARKKIFDQLAVLSAGTFANLITAILSFGILLGFFALAFAPGGVIFNPSDITSPSASSFYPFTVINVSSVTMVGNNSVINPSYQQILSLMNNSGLNEVMAGNEDYLITKSSIEAQNNTEKIAVYYDAPAIRAGLAGIILDINGQKINDAGQLSTELHKYSPGDSIVLTMMNNSRVYNQTIILAENPGNKGHAWLGIVLIEKENNGIMNQLYNVVSSFRDSNVYYASKIGDFGIFIYNLLWWLAIIAISVALVNMLPVGIFDGGRFFYLTVLAITKRENIAKNAFKVMTYFFLFVLVVVMAFWIFYIK
ncbi:MAG: site-2 protease family protein [Nanoarchaeota archaeon]|nr:site-2 protease family protein [Nanoarchaeota archaeon]